LAREVDALTFDHEHVPAEILQALVAEGLGTPRPGPSALIHAQDKLVMRRRLTEPGHPCPRWCHITSRADLANALADPGPPAPAPARARPPLAPPVAHRRP